MQRFSVQRGLALVVRKQPFSAKKAKTVELKTANINLAVDKEFESKTLREVLDLPPHALQGVAEHSNKFYASLSINTISELGKWKYYHIAKAISVLASKEETDGRLATSQLNIDKAVDKAFDFTSFKELLKQPPSALSGLSIAHDAVLEELHIKTISDIAHWKFAATADSIITLAKFEVGGPKKVRKPKTEEAAGEAEQK